jgi:hypothetical protein
MWTYEQATGRLFDYNGDLVATGYSGAPAGKNNPLMQNVSKVGPLPRGLYTLQPPVNSHVHGPYAIPLAPSTGNVMFGRDAFMCHGDSKIEPGTASEGCIIMPFETRVKMWESKDHVMQVIEG